MPVLEWILVTAAVFGVCAIERFRCWRYQNPWRRDRDEADHDAQSAAKGHTKGQRKNAW